MISSIKWSKTFVQLALCHLPMKDYDDNVKSILRCRLDLLEIFPSETPQTRQIGEITKELWILENLLGTLQMAQQRKIFPEKQENSEGLKLFETTICSLKNALCSQNVQYLARQVGSVARWQSLSDSIRFFEVKCALMRLEADRDWQRRQGKLKEKHKRKEELKNITQNASEPEEGEIMLKKKRNKSPIKPAPKSEKGKKKKTPIK